MTNRQALGRGQAMHCAAVAGHARVVALLDSLGASLRPSPALAPSALAPRASAVHATGGPLGPARRVRWRGAGQVQLCLRGSDRATALLVQQALSGMEPQAWAAEEARREREARAAAARQWAAEQRAKRELELRHLEARGGRVVERRLPSGAGVKIVMEGAAVLAAWDGMVASPPKDRMRLRQRRLEAERSFHAARAAVDKDPPAVEQARFLFATARDAFAPAPLAFAAGWGALRRAWVHSTSQEAFLKAAGFSLPRAAASAAAATAAASAALTALYGARGFRYEARRSFFAEGDAAQIALSATVVSADLAVLFVALRVAPFCVFPFLVANVLA